MRVRHDELVHATFTLRVVWPDQRAVCTLTVDVEHDVRMAAEHLPHDDALVLALQEELSSTENKISFARQSYNDQVLGFNNKIQMFPSNIVAGMFSFTKRDFFEIEDAAQRAVPKVSFN